MYDMNQESFDLSINRSPLDDFEGFTSNEMHGLLYSPYDEDKSPLILYYENNEELINQVPFFKHICQYLQMLMEQQPLKLTQKGNLPRNFCRELYDMGIFEHEIHFFKKHPIMKEEDSYYIHMINIFSKLIGLTKKEHGKIMTTKKCMKYLESKSSSDFYRYLFSTYTRNFNWGYSDLYPDAWILQGGFGFSIFLVQKYGDKAREMKFYSDKYLRAFQSIMRDFPDEEYSTSEKQFQRCYYIRVFERFLKRFGLIDIEEKGDFPSKTQIIMKKELIDHIIKWKI